MLVSVCDRRAQKGGEVVILGPSEDKLQAAERLVEPIGTVAAALTKETDIGSQRSAPSCGRRPLLTVSGNQDRFYFGTGRIQFVALTEVRI
nr:hypothetical protein [Rhizobium sp. P28RR-XV]NLR86232.1 hypothetical protein [Rhizobium sp. P28RR-XV]